MTTTLPPTLKRGLLFLGLLTFHVFGFSQQTLTKIGGWNAYVHLPDDYNVTQTKYPVIISIAGIGNIGTDPALMLHTGPMHFIANGNKMQFTVNNVVEKPIVIAIQPVTAWPRPDLVNSQLDIIFSKWRIDLNRVYVTGYSMGGWTWDNYVTYSQEYAKKITAIVSMSAPEADNPLPNYNWYASSNGKWWGFEGTLDYRKMDLIRDQINTTAPNAAHYTAYVGGHCCWNTWYNPDWKENGESIYEWMLKQNSGNTVTVPNTPPVVSAGTDTTITLPASFVTLTGTATSSTGSIKSYSWSQISGPSTSGIVTPGANQTTVVNLVSGIYKYELAVTDNLGTVAKDTVRVTVNSQPVATNGCNISNPVTYILNPTNVGEIYLPKGTGILSKVKGGDTLKIPAGNYNLIVLGKFGGDACNPVVIINTGGAVQSNYMRIDGNARYFKVTGTGVNTIKYGFVLGAPGSPYAISVGIAHHYEISNVECLKSDVGFYLKKNPDANDTATIYPNYTIRKVTVHDNYVHNVRGEGMYIGHTYPKADPYSNNLVPVRMDSVEIYNNIVDSTDWDGIQLSNALNGALIHHNSVKHFGLTNVAAQQAGIILGANTNGKVYNNSIQGGTGNGIQVFGYGLNTIYNNIVTDAGQDGSANKQDAIFIDDRPMDNTPGLKVNVINNTVINSGRDGVRIYSSNGSAALGSQFYNNLIVKPGSINYDNSPYINFPSDLGTLLANNFQKATVAEAGFVNSGAGDYHLSAISAAIDFGKDVSALGINSDFEDNNRPYGAGYDAGAYEATTARQVNKQPVVNAGGDQIIELPTTTASLNGTASDPDGTITAYRWSKISGPAGSTLSDSTQLQPDINGLVAGIYLYQLKVTDNGGATASDTLKLTVSTIPVGFKVNLFPNPFVTNVHIRINIPTKVTSSSITIMDKAKKTVYRETNSIPSQVYVRNVNVSALHKGKYFMEVNINGTIKTMKLIRN